MFIFIIIITILVLYLPIVESNTGKAVVDSELECKKNRTLLYEAIDKDEKIMFHRNDAHGKVLLYFTSVLDARWGNSDHISQFRHIWPIAMRKNAMLRIADILIYAGVFSGGEVMDWSDGLQNQTATPAAVYCELIHAVRSLPNINITIRFVANPGYQSGAVKAMIDGHVNGWFASYDWVIRLNPDVIVYDETRLATAMQNKGCFAVLSNCASVEEGAIVMSDFFAFRPKLAAHGKKWIEQLEVRDPDAQYQAEGWTTSLFLDSYLEGKRYWIQSYGNGGCRIDQPDILHGHYNWEDQIYKFFNASYQIKYKQCKQGPQGQCIKNLKPERKDLIN